MGLGMCLRISIRIRSPQIYKLPRRDVSAASAQYFGRNTPSARKLSKKCAECTEMHCNIEHALKSALFFTKFELICMKISALFSAFPTKKLAPL